MGLISMSFVASPRKSKMCTTSAPRSRWLSAGETSFADSKRARRVDRKSTRLNSSHLGSSYAVFCLKKKNKIRRSHRGGRGRVEDHTGGGISIAGRGGGSRMEMREGNERNEGEGTTEGRGSDDRDAD